MDKYLNEEGQVGVIVSGGFGAGWSSWQDEKHAEFFTMDKTLVEMKLAGKTSEEVEKYLETQGHDTYMGAWTGARVEFLTPGTVFKIDEYDGSESLVVLADLALKA